MAHRRVTLGPRTVDLDSGELSDGGALRPKELALLRHLVDRAGATVPYDQLLVEVWGFAPTVRTNTVHMTLRRLRQALEPDPGEPRLLRTVPGEGVQLVLEASVPPTNVPPRAAPLVGREELLAWLDANPGPLVTLIGPGGVGKTSLALAHADAALPRTSGGVWFCDAAGATDAATLTERAAAVLGCDATPEAVPRWLTGRGPLLVVLDNLEQVEGAGPLVDAWAAASPPEVRWLCTSRQPLGAAREQRCVVPPLPVPADQADPDAIAASPAVRLLLARCRAADPGFAAEPAQLAALSRMVDGLPLFLEIVASHAAQLGAAAVLRQRPTALDSLEPRGARHRSVESVIGWSWALQEGWVHQALRQLEVFEGPFSVPAAEAVLALPSGAPPAPSALARLVERGWVERIAGAGPRFRLFHLVQAFLDELGDPDGSTAALHAGAVARHIAYHRALADRLSDEDLLLSGWRTLERDVDGLLLAAERTLADGAGDELLISRALAVGGARSRRRRLSLAQAVLDRPIAADPEDPRRALSPSARTRVWARAAILRCTELDPGWHAAGAAAWEEAVEAGCPELLANPLTSWIWEQQAGQTDLPWVARGQALADALSARLPRVAAELRGTILCSDLAYVDPGAELDRARGLFERALALATEHDLDSIAARAYSLFGHHLLELGRAQEAEPLLRLGYARAEGTALRLRCAVRLSQALRRTDPAECRALLDDTLHAARRHDRAVWIGYVLTARAELELACGELDAAEATALEALALVEARYPRMALAPSLDLAEIALRRGGPSAALRARLEDLIRRAVAVARPELVQRGTGLLCNVLVGLGAVAQALEVAEEAALADRSAPLLHCYRAELTRWLGDRQRALAIAREAYENQRDVGIGGVLAWQVAALTAELGGSPAAPPEADHPLAPLFRIRARWFADPTSEAARSLLDELNRVPRLPGEELHHCVRQELVQLLTAVMPRSP